MRLFAKSSFVFLSAICVAACSTSTSSNPSGEPLPTSPTEDAAVPAGKVRVGVDFDVEGHRGARGLKPENTLPAFEVALDLGVTTLELDLHLTKDDAIVISHDPFVVKARCKLDPNATAPLPPDPATAKDNDPSLLIRNLTLAELRKYRCDGNPNVGQFPAQTNTPTKIAGDRYGFSTLEELFELVDTYARSPDKTDAMRAAASRVQFNIETKRKPETPETIGDGFDGTNPGTFEKVLVAAIAKNEKVSRCIVQSFDKRSLWAVHTLDPALRLSVLTEFGTIDLADYAKRGAAIWSPNFGLVTAELLRDAHAAKLRVVPWTVDDPDEIRRLAELGVDGIISDRPDVVLELIER